MLLLSVSAPTSHKKICHTINLDIKSPFYQGACGYLKREVATVDSNFGNKTMRFLTNLNLKVYGIVSLITDLEHQVMLINNPELFFNS